LRIKDGRFRDVAMADDYAARLRQAIPKGAVLVTRIEYHLDHALDVAIDRASAPMSTPRRRAILERTEATFSCSPSISLVLTTSSVSATKLA
jgi:hypothetical protein